MRILRRVRSVVSDFSPVIKGTVFVMLLGALIVTVFGCASNPVSAAKTVDQKAFAVYGTFVIFEEQAAKVMTDPNVPANLKQAVRAADLKAKPAADAILAGYRAEESIRTQLAAGVTTADKLTIATANLSQWVATGETDVNALVNAVKSAPGH